MMTDVQMCESRYRALFENSMDAIFQTVPSGEITAANQAACALFGMTELELRQAGCAGLIDTADPRLAAALKKREGLGKSRCELVCVRKDGSKFPAELSSITLDARTSFILLRDISERYQVEDALQKCTQYKLLVEEELRKMMAYELHDDVGQLVTALDLRLTSLRQSLKGMDYSTLRLRLKPVEALVGDLKRAVRKLMQETHSRPIHALGLSTAVRGHVAHFVQSTGLNIETYIDPLLPRLQADVELALFRIMQEALNNAAKHAAATKVAIRLESCGTAVRLSIADDGRGFCPGTDLSPPSRSGWGLSIMRERAKRVRGSFSLETAVGEGTAIIVEVNYYADGEGTYADGI